MAFSTQFFGVTLLAVAAFLTFRACLPQHAPDFHIAHILLLSGAIGLSCALFWKLWVYPSFVDPLRYIPGPKGGIPFIGYGAEQFKRPPSPKIYDWLTSIKNEGLLRYPGLLGSYRYVPTSPKVLSELLVTKSYDFHKPEQGRIILRLALGDGLVVAEGDLHRFQRKNVNPMFSFRHIKDLYPLMWSKAVELTKCINSEIYTNGNPENGFVIELSQWASRATLDIIGVAALGREFNTLHNTDDELVQLYEWIFQPDSKRLMWFAINLLIPRKIVGLLPWNIEKETVGKAIALRKVCRQLLKNKREQLKQETVESVDTLAHLIRSHNFSDHELVDQLLTFLAAGHETTSSAFTWLLYMLAMHPEYQSKVRQEIQQHVGYNALKDPNANLAATLEHLPWLNAVCNETLRLWPSVPVTLRTAVHDTNIGGHAIAKGTEFVVSIWWINRLPALWGPNAADFYPERWIDFDDKLPNGLGGKPNHHGGAQSNYALLTFLHGPRSCIGQNFAKAELRALTAAWMLNFEFEMGGPKGRDEKVTPFGLVTVKPKEGLLLRVKPVAPSS